ncbi:BLUF domain-containing protein [Sphingomonas koreensis]|nr:BLUF domain-containing protein [Sphingomonas koreensis]
MRAPREGRRHRIMLGVINTMESILYISTSTLDRSTADRVVEALAADSVARNDDRDLTGALIFTGTHFVQILEGAPEKIELLLCSLRADNRHREIVIIERGQLSARRFSSWRMAYAGPSQFIGRKISRVLNDPSPGELRWAAGWLTHLMQEFVAP